MMTVRFLLAAALALFATQPRAMTGEEPEFRALADNVYVWIGKRNEANAMAIVTTQGVVVVDSGHSPPETRKFAKAIASVTSQPVRWLVVTQNHGDHIGGATFFMSPATLVIHDRVAKALASMKPYQLKAWRARFPERAEALKGLGPLDAVISFPDRATLRLGETIIELFHVADPYNDGDIGVFLPQTGILHAGFVGYRERHPDIRPDFSHGTTAGMMKQLEAMIALKPKIVVPGHGPVASVEHLKIEIDYLLAARAKVRAMMDRGLPLAAIKRDFNMNEYADWDLPDHFPIIAETIFRELRGDGPLKSEIAEKRVEATIVSIAELGRFLTVATDGGETLKLRISNETWVEGIADRALLKPGRKISALYEAPASGAPALGYLVMEVVVPP